MGAGSDPEGFGGGVVVLATAVVVLDLRGDPATPLDLAWMARLERR